MSALNPLLFADVYKDGHIDQFPKGTTEVYSYLTARNGRHAWPEAKEVVAYGLEDLVRYYFELVWGEFFNNPAPMIEEYKKVMSFVLGRDICVKRFEDLAKQGRLPLHVRAVREAERVPFGVPILTVRNTHPDFYWLPGFIETALLAEIWKPMTVATIAARYRDILDKYAEKTTGCNDFVEYQLHDFSARGMTCLQDMEKTGMAHLQFFNGSDNLAAIAQVYRQTGEREACSVPATEHSVMCAHGEEGEFEAFKRLITEVYPTGVVSIVSDTWNLWRVVGEYLPRLKEEIMSRNGCVVIRPDSGDPLEILTGDPEGQREEERKGLIRSLYDLFGGGVNQKGYIQLDKHIGAIYGDSISPDRAESILEEMDKQGFASSNIVFGVGGASYGLLTRDTFGFAFKATSAVVNGERRILHKDPVTAGGSKTSAKGLLFVGRDPEGKLVYEENVSLEAESASILGTVYLG